MTVNHRHNLNVSMMIIFLFAITSDVAHYTVGGYRLPSIDIYGWRQEFSGYLASVLVLATFAMQSMRPLRITAIASNLAFISYAMAAHLLPILILHSLLLPMNIVRLLQIEAGRRRVRNL